MAFPLAQPARVRPATVKIASTLLIVLGVVELARVGITLYEWQLTKEVFRDLISDPTKQSNALTALTAVTLVGVALTVIIGVGMVMVGVFTGRGKQAARVLAWVIGGLVLLCTGLSLAGGLFSSGTSSTQQADPDLPSPEELTKALQAKSPGWLTPVSQVVGLVAVLGMIVVVVMLALPASNEYFRKPVPVFIPPTEWPPPGAMPPSALPPAAPQSPPAPPAGGDDGPAPPK
jgi:hypothetical protein